MRCADRPPAAAGARPARSRHSTPACRGPGRSPKLAIGSRSNRVAHELHRITARTSHSIRFADVSSLAAVGVDPRRYASFDYAATQALAAAAFFLDFDGLIVPSARSADLNLVIFTEKLDPGERLKLEATEMVDWPAWRSTDRKRAAK